MDAVDLYYKKSKYLEGMDFVRKYPVRGGMPTWIKGKMTFDHSEVSNSTVTFEQFASEVERRRLSLHPILGIDIFDATHSELVKKKIKFLKENGFKHVLARFRTSNYIYNFEKSYPETKLTDVIQGDALEDTFSWDQFMLQVQISRESRLDDMRKEAKRERLNDLGYGKQFTQSKGPDLMDKRLPGSFGSKKGY